MSMITQSAISPASSLAHRCRVTASLNVLLSSSSRVTVVTMSIRWVIDAIDASAPGAAFAASFPASFPAALGRCERAGAVCWGAAVITSTGGSPGRSIAVAVSVMSSWPSAASMRQSARRGPPVRATAASCVCTAARDPRSTKFVSGLPVAYPVGTPSSVAAP